MPDQNWADPFNAAKTQAEGRRQQAISDAHTAHAVAVDKLRNTHAAEAREPDPDAQYHRQVRELKALNDALDREVRKADVQFKSDLVAAGQRHNVSVTVHDQR